ncbi:hypothetical protein AB0M95_02310 [Sphaerisporangium sp. NPDC051017]|uniref:hypothetical protein n=1 Tax=Sphaerisporangium sp. NPDC051017 TaxID=3154636 RepID=UPI00342C2928
MTPILAGHLPAFAAQLATAADALAVALQRSHPPRLVPVHGSFKPGHLVFEAAALLEMASRRVHRLNSPRPGEPARVLGEIDVCLRRFTRERTRP